MVQWGLSAARPRVADPRQLADRLRRWIERAQKKGDAVAFQFVRFYAYDAVYRWVSKRVQSTVEAEVIVERVFDEAWKTILTFESRRGAVLPWLFGITRRAIGMYYRQHQVMQPLPDDDRGIAGAVPGPEEQFAQAEREKEEKMVWQQVKKALAGLPYRRRQVIVLRHLKQYSCVQIAIDLKTTVEAARQLHYNALRDIASALKLK